MSLQLQRLTCPVNTQLGRSSPAHVSGQDRTERRQDGVGVGVSTGAVL